MGDCHADEKLFVFRLSSVLPRFKIQVLWIKDDIIVYLWWTLFLGKGVLFRSVGMDYTSPNRSRSGVPVRCSWYTVTLNSDFLLRCKKLQIYMLNADAVLLESRWQSTSQHLIVNNSPRHHPYIFEEPTKYNWDIKLIYVQYYIGGSVWSGWKGPLAPQLLKNENGTIEKVEHEWADCELFVQWRKRTLAMRQCTPVWLLLCLFLSSSSSSSSVCFDVVCHTSSVSCFYLLTYLLPVVL